MAPEALGNTKHREFYSLPFRWLTTNAHDIEISWGQHPRSYRQALPSFPILRETGALCRARSHLTNSSRERSKRRFYVESNMGRTYEWVVEWPLSGWRCGHPESLSKRSFLCIRRNQIPRRKHRLSRFLRRQMGRQENCFCESLGTNELQVLDLKGIW